MGIVGKLPNNGMSPIIETEGGEEFSLPMTPGEAEAHPIPVMSSKLSLNDP